jgi:hypothetical protein
MHGGQRVARLRALFQAAVSLTLAGGAGCSSRIDPGDFSNNVCTGGNFIPLLGVSPTRPVDYLELRQRAVVDRGLAPTSVTLLGIGAPCGLARDGAACMRAYTTATQAQSGWDATADAYQGPGRRTVVFTRGDAVGLVDSLDALAAFLGPIELPVEAAWLANERGYTILCDGNNVRRAGTGFELRVRTGVDCGPDSTLDEHVVAVGADGSFRVVETVRVREGAANCVAGRRGEGIAPPPAAQAETLGAYLAQMAGLEAASVLAFERLAQELAAFGAPAALVRKAQRAARDEVRHAAVDGAARVGASGARCARGRRDGAPLPTRTPFEVASGKRRRGLRARDLRRAPGHLPGVARPTTPSLARDVSQTIARDETRHAALAWEVAAWLEPGCSRRPSARRWLRRGGGAYVGYVGGSRIRRLPGSRRQACPRPTRLRR